jgi:asparagine synthase (glutamine-hydrolysing)
MSDLQYANLIKTKLEDAVKSHLVSDAKLGVLFSAGLDSSLIAAIASKESKGEINLFKYQSENLDDSSLVKKFKKIFNSYIYTIERVDNQIIFELPRLIYHYETINKSDGTPLAMCCENARKKGLKVLLTGDAADEIFGGYQTLESYITKKKIKSIRGFQKIKRILNKIIPGFSDLMGAELDYMISPFSTDFLETFLDIELYGGNRKIQFQEAANAYSFITNKSEKDINAFLLDELGGRLERFLIRNDRFGMMESIEIRVPFLSKEIVKIAVNTPYYMKCKLMPSIMGKKVYSQKYVLKKVAELIDIPRGIIYRAKVGTPMGQSNYSAQEIIFNKWGLKNAAKFLNLDEKVLKKTIHLANSKEEKQRQIWNMLSLEILIREFILNIDFRDIRREFKEIIES